MKSESKENMQRAIGILEGVLFTADEKTSVALEMVVNMLDEIYSKENENEQRKAD